MLARGETRTVITVLTLVTLLALVAASGSSCKKKQPVVADETEQAAAAETAEQGDRKGIGALAGTAERKLQRARERGRQHLRKLAALAGLGKAKDDQGAPDAGEGAGASNAGASEEAERKRAEAMRIAAERAKRARAATDDQGK